MQSRVQQMSDFFMNYRKDPNKESNLLDFFLDNTYSIKLHNLERGMLKCKKSHSSFFPTLQQLIDCVEEEMPQLSFQQVDCFKCNKTGLIHSTFFYDEETEFNLEIVGMQHTARVKTLEDGEIVPVEGFYFTKVIGRCDCANGNRMSKGSLPVVQPLKYIQNLAKENEWDCQFQADQIKWHFHYKRLGQPHPMPREGIKKLINAMLNTQGDELWEENQQTTIERTINSEKQLDVGQQEIL